MLFLNQLLNSLLITQNIRMTLKSFLKKVGRGIAKAGRWVKNKAIPFVGRLAKPILNGISMLPANWA